MLSSAATSALCVQLLSFTGISGRMQSVIYWMPWIRGNVLIVSSLKQTPLATWFDFLSLTNNDFKLRKYSLGYFALAAPFTLDANLSQSVSVANFAYKILLSKHLEELKIIKQHLSQTKFQASSL